MIFERLLVFDDPIPGSGPWNMAMDEALGEAIEVPVLRVYGWAEPTVSFGYFEKIETIRQLRPDIPLVRRWTGGGVVDHGEDWTYSLIVPTIHALAKCLRGESYAAIHRAVKGVLAQRERGEIRLAAGGTGEGVGCFERPVPGDLLSGGKKIAGAAQRRTRQFLLHQGSIQNFPEGNWRASDFANGLADSWENFVTPQSLISRAGEILETRYGTRGWLEKF